MDFPCGNRKQKCFLCILENTAKEAILCDAVMAGTRHSPSACQSPERTAQKADPDVGSGLQLAMTCRDWLSCRGGTRLMRGFPVCPGEEVVWEVRAPCSGSLWTQNCPEKQTLLNDALKPFLFALASCRRDKTPSDPLTQGWPRTGRLSRAYYLAVVQATGVRNLKVT